MLLGFVFAGVFVLLNMGGQVASIPLGQKTEHLVPHESPRAKPPLPVPSPRVQVSQQPTEAPNQERKQRPADWFNLLAHRSASDSDNNYLIQIASACPVPPDKRRLVLEVGGNKGYAIPRYNFLWGNMDNQLVFDSIKHLQSKTHMFRENLLTVEVFEPTKSAINVLSTLLGKLPSLLGVTINQMGVSDEDGEATFYTPYANVGDEGAHMGRTRSIPEEGPKETVKIVQLDTFLDQKYPSGFPGPIVYVKIDTEGFDALCVRGMKRSLEKGLIWAFQFEFLKSWKDGRTKEKEYIKPLGDWLASIGYACYGYVVSDQQGNSGFIRWNGPGFWDDRVENIEFNPQCINTKLPCYANFELSYIFS